VRLDRADRFAPVRAALDDLDVFVRLETDLQSLDRSSSSTRMVRMVMRPLLFTFSSWKGISISTENPPAGAERDSKR
jgi:hypothetical protein